MPSNSHSPRVVVVGTGVSGLAAAHALLASAGSGPALDVTVLEASERSGGKLLTLDLDGMPIEAGADSFVVRKPWAVELCQQLGLQEDVVIPASWGAYVWTRGRLVAYPERSPFGIPSDLGDLLGWQGLPRGPKLRAALDLFRPARRGHEDEALGTLLRRRLGTRASRVLVEPLLGGLHAGDPMRLSVQATFPDLVEWERRHGSLLRGAKAAAGAAGEEKGHKPLFATLWGGLSTLVERLVETIGRDRVRLRQPVDSIAFESGEFSVRTGSPGSSPLRAEAVILATPAYESARLLGSLSREVANELSEIPYASTAVVFLAYPPGTASRLPFGTGLVVPTGEGTMTACTWVSRKWPREEFAGRAVLRCFVGRAGAERGLELSDQEMVAAIAGEVERATPMGVGPSASRVVRWDRSMPQYEVGHLERVARIEKALSGLPGLFVTGSAYRGVGIPDCIRQGREAAERVLDYIHHHDRMSVHEQRRREASWQN